MGLRFKSGWVIAQKYLTWLIQNRSGRQVLDGPFSGMHYIECSFGSCYLPKLTGAYERELNPVIEHVLTQPHDLLVDIGAAEGYFAVGLARRSGKTIVAFEESPIARDLTMRLASINEVADQISLYDRCTPENLEAVLHDADYPFVLIDVEGSESDILDPLKAPSLLHTSILAELHEFDRPGLTALLLTRFQNSHRIEMIWQDERKPDEFPFQSWLTQLLPKRYLSRAMDEERFAKQAWMWMVPNRRQNMQLVA